MADELSPKEQLTRVTQHDDKPSRVEAFDRVAANLRQQWEDDGLKGPRDRWEDLSVLYKVSYLADFAVAYGVSFERFAAAARHTLGMMPGQQFTVDHQWYVAHEYYGHREKYALRGADEERLATMKNRSGEVSGVPESKHERAGTYQVWHDRGWPQSRLDQMLGGAPPSRFPQSYFHAADVQTESLEESVQLTTSKGHVLKGDHQPWDDNRGVRSYTPKPFVPRDTDAGDVIVDPQGRAYRVERNGFSEVEAVQDRFPSPSDIARDKQPYQPEQGHDHGYDKGRG